MQSIPDVYGGSHDCHSSLLSSTAEPWSFQHPLPSFRFYQGPGGWFQPPGAVPQVWVALTPSCGPSSLGCHLQAGTHTCLRTRLGLKDDPRQSRRPSAFTICSRSVILLQFLLLLFNRMSTWPSLPIPKQRRIQSRSELYEFSKRDRKERMS